MVSNIKPFFFNRKWKYFKFSIFIRTAFKVSATIKIVYSNCLEVHTVVVINLKSIIIENIIDIINEKKLIKINLILK